jgi:hypothetical protein
MTPPKFGAPGQYVRVTRQGQRRKERMRQPKMWSSWKMSPPQTQIDQPEHGLKRKHRQHNKENRAEFWGPEWYSEP